MKDHCKFLTEEETYKYFGLLSKDHEDIINYAQYQATPDELANLHQEWQTSTVGQKVKV